MRRGLQALAVVDVRRPERAPVLVQGDEELPRAVARLRRGVARLRVEKDRRAVADVHVDVAQRCVEGDRRAGGRRDVDGLVGVPVAPDGVTAAGEDTGDGGHVGVKDGRDEDVAADEELPVDTEELGLLRELEPEGADGGRAVCRGVRKESVLWART